MVDDETGRVVVVVVNRKKGEEIRWPRKLHRD